MPLDDLPDTIPKDEDGCDAQWNRVVAEVGSWVVGNEPSHSLDRSPADIAAFESVDRCYVVPIVGTTMFGRRDEKLDTIWAKDPFGWIGPQDDRVITAVHERSNRRDVTFLNPSEESCDDRLNLR